jgi:hypothetical protein
MGTVDKVTDAAIIDEIRAQEAEVVNNGFWFA